MAGAAFAIGQIRMERSTGASEPLPDILSCNEYCFADSRRQTVTVGEMYVKISQCL